MGFYPAPPGPKIWYDADGSVMFYQTTGSPSSIQAEAVNLNGERVTGQYSANQGRIGLLFPTLLDIIGVFLLQNSTTPTTGSVRTTTFSTNGEDGTWTDQGPLTLLGTNLPVGAYRSNIQTVSYLGIKGITFAGPAFTNWFPRNLHLYGTYSTGENPDRLRFWHPTTDNVITPGHFDYEEIPQGTPEVIQFRVKNNSATKTANTITVATSALTNPSPTLTSQTTFSTDGSAYLASISIGNLAPGAISSVLYARLLPTGAAQTGAWRQRFTASAVSFS